MSINPFGRMRENLAYDCKARLEKINAFLTATGSIGSFSPVEVLGKRAQFQRRYVPSSPAGSSRALTTSI